MADVTGMQSAGRVMPLYKGDYNNATAYAQLDVVLYNNSSYIAKQATTGHTPPSANSDAYWQLIAKGIIDADVSASTATFTEATTRTNIASGETVATIFGKIKKFFTDLKTVAFTGSYSDLSNKPTIPNVGNGTVTIKQAGAQKGAFTMNQSGNTTIELTDNNTIYSLPLAAPGTRGGVKTGYAANGKNYPVQLSNEQMYVNVPWTDTNTQTITGVKGNAESSYRTGNVNLTPANIGAVATSKVLTTKEQVNANTDANNVAGAVALKDIASEINSKTTLLYGGPFDLGIVNANIERLGACYISTYENAAVYHSPEGKTGFAFAFGSSVERYAIIFVEKRYYDNSDKVGNIYVRIYSSNKWLKVKELAVSDLVD